MSKIIQQILVIAALLVTYNVSAQQPEADSIRQLIKKSKGIEKVMLLNELAAIQQSNDPEECYKLSVEAQRLLISLDPDGTENWHYERAQNYCNFGTSYLYRSMNDSALLALMKSYSMFDELMKNSSDSANLFGYIKLQNYISEAYDHMNMFDSAIAYAEKTISICNEFNIVDDAASAYNAIGTVKMKLGDFKSAEENHNKALELYTVINDEQGMSPTYNSLGIVRYYQSDFEGAIRAFQKAYDLQEKFQNKFAMATLINNIGNIYYLWEHNDQALEKYHKAIQMFEELGNDQGMAMTCRNMGIIYGRKEEHDKALKYYNLAYEKAKQSKDEQTEAEVLNEIGYTYYLKDKLNKAEEYLIRAVSLNKELGMKLNLSNTLTNLSKVYIATNNIEKALQCLDESMNLAKEVDVKEQIVNNLQTYAEVYEAAGDYKKAFLYYVESTELKDSIFSSESQQTISELQVKFDTKKKEDSIKISLLKSKVIQDSLDITKAEKILADQEKLEADQKRIEAERISEKERFAREISEAETDKLNQRNNYLIIGVFMLLGLVALVYRNYRHKKKSNFELSRRNDEILQQKEEIHSQAEELQAINDELHEVNQKLEKLSIVARETDNAIVIASADGTIEWVNEGFTSLYGYTKYEFISKYGKTIQEASQSEKISDSLEKCIRQKKPVIYECEIQHKEGKQVWIQTTLSPVLGYDGNIEKLVAINSDISKLKKAQHEINIQKAEIEAQRDLANLQKGRIEKQNEEIMDSIQYALRIQNAILPGHALYEKYFSEYFILYQPRDIVSGDFYWVLERDNRLFIAVSDCTGHGVPGAFMSIIGTIYLNEIIKYKKVYNTDEILNELRKNIIKFLNSNDHLGPDGHLTNSEQEVKDGMDIALIALDLNQLQNEEKINVQFSGAFNPLYHIAGNIEGQVEVYNSDPMPIGIYHSEIKSFTRHEFMVEKGDQLFMFSDGFIDQFGGPKGRKVKKKIFREMLYENKELSMIEQRKELFDYLNSWMNYEGNKYEQIDDITVMGLKI
jgi:PAS domain S-box-containing protein